MAKKAIASSAMLKAVTPKVIGPDARKVLKVSMELPYTEATGATLISNLGNTMVLKLEQYQGDLNDFVDPAKDGQEELPGTPPTRRKATRKKTSKKAVTA